MRPIVPVSIWIIGLLSACHVFLGPDPDTSPQGVLYTLWKDFNEIHAYLDKRMPNNGYNNWEEVLNGNQNKTGYRTILQYRLNSSTNVNKALFDTCADMLNELDDPHVSLHAPGKSSYSTKVKTEPSNFRNIVISNLGEWASAVNLIYGRVKPGLSSGYNIGYIYIASFTDRTSSSYGVQNWAKAIDSIVGALADTDAMVIDIRYNGGGSPANGEYIAARFTSVQTDYMKESVKNGPGLNDFSAPIISTIRPAGTRYTKPVALLTNEGTGSMAEWFTMALRTHKHITHVGIRTTGALSGRLERSMVNGWYYSISFQKITDMFGNCYEVDGIIPKEKYQPANNIDEELLKSAIKYLADNLP
ncbi:MAG: S41 family peptidase [Treponema sp.]|jgi:C-terminal processing protease CtpA/Prc|nr:S41 family peptidase [Treponema sp.]